MIVGAMTDTILHKITMCIIHEKDGIPHRIIPKDWLSLFWVAVSLLEHFAWQDLFRSQNITKFDELINQDEHFFTHNIPRWLRKDHGSLINNNNNFDEKVAALANCGRGGSNSKQ